MEFSTGESDDCGKANVKFEKVSTFENIVCFESEAHTGSTVEIIKSRKSQTAFH
jgi:hypothetical protein